MDEEDVEKELELSSEDSAWENLCLNFGSSLQIFQSKEVLRKRTNEEKEKRSDTCLGTWAFQSW